MKMSKDSSAKYYQNNKERLQKKKLMRDTKVFLKKKKKRKWQYGPCRYKNLPEDGKQKLVEYRKNIIKWETAPYYNYKKLLF